MRIRHSDRRAPGRRAVLLVCLPVLLAACLLRAPAAAASGATVIGSSTRAMSPNRTTQSYGARVEETALGNYVADAFRQAAGTDIAIECGGHLVKSLPGGDLTAADAAAVFDRDRMVVAVELTAGQLFALLEHGVGTLDIDEAEQLDPESGFDGFPQVSGFSFVYDVSQKPGRRVRSVTLDGGAALSAGETRTLTAALPADMLDGSLGFSMLEGLPARPVGLQSELLSSLIAGQQEVSIPETSRAVVLGTAEHTLFEALHARFWLPYLILIILVIRLPMQRHRARNADGSLSRRYRN
ncbi:5'-nucleotidase C-terminal domain-containing protein [Lawsonibacter celer]|jgi:hypothetical protein|uniref:5'-nucleotidase C-terminal domain-containing protein n=1 Tax=Lawsonibacter celer TaxID=2986526 RepID=UPI00164806F6|nr:5'-nucleotidase [Lawsonibacter celer]